LTCYTFTPHNFQGSNDNEAGPSNTDVIDIEHG